MSTQTHHLHWTRQDQQQNPYPLLPFDVPTGTAQITITYNVLPTSPETPQTQNIIDLGLFDPRGHSFLDAPGFRGWSGGARSTITISAHQATPGYLPGPIQAGTWRVLLGLYRIAPQGCDLAITITLQPGDPTPTAPPAYPSPGVLRDRPGWYRGDLHCHTHHSDATGSVADLVQAARSQNLDFIAVTDHNTISHLPDLARQQSPTLLLIPGIEITTYRGHANVWGVREWIDFRATGDAEMRRIREHVYALGLPFSINHPKHNGPAWMFDDLFDADAVEAWQGPWWLGNHESLAFWERLLRQGKRIPLVGGSDKHQKPFTGELTRHEVGMPTTWVYAQNLSERAILEGIRAGHVFVSQSPLGPRIECTAQAGGQTAMLGDELAVAPGRAIDLTCRITGGASCAENGGLLRVIDKNGETRRVRIDADDWRYTWQIRAHHQDHNYVRVEVVKATTAPPDQDPAPLVCALGNPIYIRAPSQA